MGPHCLCLLAWLALGCMLFWLVDIAGRTYPIVGILQKKRSWSPPHPPTDEVCGSMYIVIDHTCSVVEVLETLVTKELETDEISFSLRLDIIYCIWGLFFGLSSMHFIPISAHLLVVVVIGSLMSQICSSKFQAPTKFTVKRCAKINKGEALLNSGTKYVLVV